MPRRHRQDALIVKIVIALVLSSASASHDPAPKAPTISADTAGRTRGITTVTVSAVPSVTQHTSNSLGRDKRSQWQADRNTLSGNAWVGCCYHRRQKSSRTDSNSRRYFGAGYARTEGGVISRVHAGGHRVRLPPLWTRVRGGASTKAEEGGSEEESLAEDALDAIGVEAEVDDSTTVSSTGSEEGTESSHRNAAVDDEADESPDVEEDGDDDVDRESKTPTRESTKVATAVQSKSVMETLELGKVVPKVIKHAMVFGMGSWVSGKLSPVVVRQVRMARIIYTTYLIFSQGLCMYLRYLIWQSDDDSEMESPPPPQLMKLMEGIKGGPESGPGAGAASTGASPAAGAAAGSLGPMMEKLLTSKTPVKTYDMKYVQNMRRGQFWASLFMCYTHLRKGMIKPMILQVAFGILALLDSPLFKIYVLGMKAEGDLARPFKKQGLMDTLSGPMAGLSAKAEEARNLQEAAAADASNDEMPTTTTSVGTENNGESMTTTSKGECDDEQGDEETMPDIEILSEDNDDSSGSGDDQQDE